jgi:hypothetical protein
MPTALIARAGASVPYAALSDLEPPTNIRGKMRNLPFLGRALLELREWTRMEDHEK